MSISYLPDRYSPVALSSVSHHNSSKSPTFTSSPRGPYYYTGEIPLGRQNEIGSQTREYSESSEDEVTSTPSYLHFDRSLLNTTIRHASELESDRRLALSLLSYSFAPSLQQPLPSPTFDRLPPSERSPVHFPTVIDATVSPSSNLPPSPIPSTFTEGPPSNYPPVHARTCRSTPINRRTPRCKTKKVSPPPLSPKTVKSSSSVPPRNSSHIFAVHIHARPTGIRPALVNSKNTLLLRPQINDLNSSFPLIHSIISNQPYTSSDKQFDIINCTVYTFTSQKTDQWCATEWILMFTEAGELLHPVVPPEPITSSSPAQTAYTFIHFVPNSIIQAPQPIASASFWRHQICDVEHDSFAPTSNPERFWGARFDEKFKFRRPVRIVEHFSKCRLREERVEDCALGKLARAVVSTFPETKRRKGERSCSSDVSESDGDL